MKILVLEDDQNRIEEFKKSFRSEHRVIYTDDAEMAINHLKENTFDILFLDHDLGGCVYVDTNEYQTGSTVAKWLSENKDRMPPRVILHTLNSYGATNMKSYIPHAQIIPFAWTKIKV